MIEIWSNGKYKSVEHRVVTNKTKVRSIHEVFVTPALDAFIEPLDHLINAQNPKLYKKIRYGDYVNKYFNRVDDCVKPPVNNNRRVGNYANNNFNSGFGDHVNNNFNRGVGNRGVGDYVNNMGVGNSGVGNSGVGGYVNDTGIGNSGVGMGIGNSGIGGYVNDMVGDYVNDMGVDNGGVDGYVNDMGVDNEGVDGYVNPYFNKGKEGRSRIERIMLAKKD
ncbi:hypothetical protein RIF29_24181 [Crotalaria pallida]|uniref:Isopenicillin N synthase-like Fe(2+) 2OG dioxygenase domain-containing protein n=1 Tax=Crotalaria pallida TaxID=3830 RepID=A0AAN9EPF0_CROPI